MQGYNKKKHVKNFKIFWVKGHTSQQYRNASILLNSNESPECQRLSREQIAQVLHTNTKAVESVKQRFVEAGFDECMERKSYPKKGHKKAVGDFEAHLITISCSEAPEGYARWSLRLLADKMVEMKYTDVTFRMKWYVGFYKKRNQAVESERMGDPSS